MEKLNTKKIVEDCIAVFDRMKSKHEAWKKRLKEVDEKMASVDTYEEKKEIFEEYKRREAEIDAGNE